MVYFTAFGTFVPNYIFMDKPKRTSDNYIQLKKKIIDKDIRNIILIMSREWKMTEPQACYEIIRQRAIAEIEKRK